MYDVPSVVTLNVRSVLSEVGDKYLERKEQVGADMVYRYRHGRYR